MRALRTALADFSREAALHAAGIGPVAGVDEVGRGPLAGPVVAAAVILDPRAVPAGLADSKLLTPAERERLARIVLDSALAVAVAAVPAATIDRIDIRQASLLAMRRAVAGLSAAPAHVLADGNDPPVLACPCEAVVGGDARIASIAAASIVAKVARDAMMRRLALCWPGYGFERHAGYGTTAHREAIARLGPCPEHRFGFSPVKGVWRREVEARTATCG